MATIVYCTNTGTTKKYAELLSEKTGFDCVDISKRNRISPDEEIILVGWILADIIQGLKEARETFSNIKAVCGVGMIKSPKSIKDVKTKNNLTEPYFFLFGNFDINNLKGMYKLMMGMMLKSAKSKIKESGNEKGLEAISFLEEGVHGFDEKELDSLIEFLNQEK